MAHAHWLREQPTVVRPVIAFVLLATILYSLLGPIGILYALGFEVVFLVIYLLSTAFASFLDPDIY